MQDNEEKYQETFATWNRLASLYEEKFMDFDLYDATYDFFCENITRKNAHLLEIGCGPGNITKYLLTKRPDFNIYATDIAPNMIALAQKNNPDARFDLMDSRNIGDLKTTFDGIVCGFVMPYLSPPDCKKLIEDASRLLNDEGIFYLSFVEGDADNSRFLTSGTGEQIYFYYYELQTVQARLVEAGFDILKVYHLEYKDPGKPDDMHTVLIARKK